MELWLGLVFVTLVIYVIFLVIISSDKMTLPSLIGIIFGIIMLMLVGRTLTLTEKYINSPEYAQYEARISMEQSEKWNKKANEFLNKSKGEQDGNF